MPSAAITATTRSARDAARTPARRDDGKRRGFEVEREWIERIPAQDPELSLLNLSKQNVQCEPHERLRITPTTAA